MFFALAAGVDVGNICVYVADGVTTGVVTPVPALAELVDEAGAEDNELEAVVDEAATVALPVDEAAVEDAVADADVAIPEVLETPTPSPEDG